MRKISRIVITAFVLMAVLAISSFAYTVNYDNTISGLESGVNYTYAQYDFANDCYGEFAELTDTTVITSGIWGIKAGDGEPEAIFVYGADSGKTSFWTDGAKDHDAGIFNSTIKDTYAPGQWTISSNGAFINIRCYKNATLTDVSVCIDIVKAKVIEEKTITTDTQKTVTVEEVDYPVFAIDGAEYYLVFETTGDGEEAVTVDKYYAVADNAEYTGENAASAEAVYLTDITWVGIEGEGNKSQESVYYYGFTNDQVIPASELEGYTMKSLDIFTGAIPVASSHTKDEAAPKLTYFTKKIGSDVVTEYSVKNTAYANNGRTTFAVPADMPADAYIVGFAVAPYDGLPDDYFTNLYVNGAWNTEKAGYFHQYMYTSSANGVAVTEPAYEIAAPELYVENGKVKGFVEGKYYEYANVTVNVNGTDVGYSEAKVLDATVQPTGLFAARITNADRSVAGDWTKPMYIAGDSVGNIYHVTTGTTSNGVTKDFIDVASAGSWNIDALPTYKVGLWTGFSLTDSLAKNYGFDPLVLGTTSGQGTFSFLNTTDADALAKAQLQAQKHLESIYYSYTYTADEVIPMSLFKSFRFRVTPRGGQGLLDATAGAKTKFTFKVITEEGKLEDRVIYKDAGNLANTTHTVTAEDFADNTGYIVAILINPYTVDDATTIKYKNSGMVDFNVYHYLTGYSVDLPKADKPTGLYVEDNAIKGFDPDVQYGWEYYYVSGASGTVTEIPKGTTALKGVTGIVAIRVVGKNVNNSDPVLFYIPADSEGLSTLGVIDGGKPAYQSTVEWKAGVWTGPYMSYFDWNQVSGAYTFLDQAAGVTAEQAQNLWLFQVTKEEAQARLDADAQKSIESGVPASWTNNKITSNPARLQAVIDAHYTEDYEDTKADKMATLKQQIADGLTSRSIKYAYDETEIIPVGQLMEMSFVSWRRQGAFKLTGVKSKVVFTVMQLDGTTSEHEWLSEEFSVTDTWASKKVTVDVQSIEGLPTEGYIVGVEFFPWATVNASEIEYVMTSSSRVDASNVAYSFEQQQVSAGYYYTPYSSYKIKAFAEAPKVTYTPAADGGYNITIVDGNTSFAYRYKAEGDADWTAIPSNVFTFNVTDSGKYIVGVYGDSLIDTAETEINVVPVAPVAPEIIYVPAATGYVVKITNYFGAYTYEYKTSSAAKWTKVPAGDVTFKVSAAGDYVVRAGGVTYDGYAETAFTVEPLPEALTSITITDKTITGLDASKAYEYAPVTLYGIGEFTAIPAGESYEFARAGLYAIRLAATETEEATTTIAVLAYGDVAERKTIINTVSTTYASGTWWDKTPNITVDRIIIGAYADRLNPEFVEGVWMGYKLGDLAYWDKSWLNALGVVSGCVSRVNFGDKILSGEMTQQEAKDFIESYGFRYAYKPEEIIPFENLASFTFQAGGRQGHVYASDKAYTKVIAHIANAYGLVETRELLLEADFSGTGSMKRHTISAEDFGDTTGYIVAIEIIPYGYIPEETTLMVASNVDSDWYAILENYEIVLPRVETPTVTYNAETGLVEGLEEGVTYTYANFNVNGEGEATTVTGVTTLELADGLWGIRRVAENIENSNSLPAFVLIQSDPEARKVIGTRTDAGYYDISSGDNWQIGKWSGQDIGTGAPFGNLNSFGTYGGHVNGAGATALMNAIDAGDAEAEALARVRIVSLANNVKFKYAYAEDDIITVNDIINLSFSAKRRMGSLDLGMATAKVYFSVVCPDGKVRIYTWKSDRFNTNNTNSFDVNPRSIDGWPEEGYIVGFAIHPWSDVDGSAVKLTDRNGYNTMANLEFNPDKYKLVTGDEVAEKPVLEYKAFNNVIKVTNYNLFLTYAYSTDNGVTWTEFEGSSFNATKASTSYIVKSLEELPYAESEVSDAVTTAPLVLVGTSLVLDGQIGIKVYMDIDMDNVSKVDHYMTKVNNDFYADRGNLAYGEGYRVGGGTSLEESTASWATKIQLDEESGLYYYIIYIPAKDLDNTSFETDLGYWPVGSTGVLSERVQVSNIGINFAKYITAAKELAAAGDTEFVRALPLVEALETYTAYADNYFNNGEDSAYVTTASTNDVAAATRSNTALEGAEFYGTSLILEDQVTIRHYFLVTDLDAFNAAYAVEGMYGVKGSYIYFDITDISAQFMGDTKTLEIKDDEGNLVYEINYSVTNYIVDMMDDTNVNLVSLVNAMYDYYLEAKAYAK